MAAAEQVFVYNLGSSRARYSNLVSIPPEVDILDKPHLSVLRLDVILDLKKPTWPLIHDDRSSMTKLDFHVSLDGYENAQSINIIS